ncbi:MAG: hypothetical protein WAW52_09700 [Methanothrix sp.]
MVPHVVVRVHGWPLAGAAGAAEMLLDSTDDWQEFDRVDVAGTPARMGGRRPARRLRLRSSGIVSGYLSLSFILF